MNPNLFIPATFGNKLHSPAIPANQFGPYQQQITQIITKGSLVSFNYQNYKNDPYPLILVSDVNYANAFIRGVNLHYLVFPDIRRLLQPNANNLNFSYQANIKGNETFTSSFRQYKRRGIRMLKKLDTTFLLNILASVRSLNPAEVQSIRNSIREQIRQLTNPVAEQTIA